MEVIQPPHQALEIADAVAVRIHVGTDGETIDDRVLVPEIVDHFVPLIIVPRRSAAPLAPYLGRIDESRLKIKTWVAMMIGTRNVISKLSGSRSIAAMDAGSARP